MVEFPGYEDLIRRVYKYKQEQVFLFWPQLNRGQRQHLLSELRNVDFDQCAEQFALSSQTTEAIADFEPAEFIKSPRHGGNPESWHQAEQLGLAHIRDGKLCAFVVAGGQGSRLGYDGPKGAFRISPVRKKSLFEIHCQKIRKYQEKYKARIPFFVMTSESNHAATLAHFEEQGFFGLDRDQLVFFAQAMIPTLDTRGKLLLASPCSLFRNPDGHGGSLTALKKSGALDTMYQLGIETISYFQVDNPTVKIIDPVFIGFHLMEQAEVSTKVLLKTGPEEKVGNLVRFANGKTGVIEYSDLPRQKAWQTGPDGQFVYQAGSIGIHLFGRDFVYRLGQTTQFSLPFHVARKKVQAYGPNGPLECEAFKFEKFVFDALPLAGKTLAMEALREEEFAPVKNKDGVDSIESSRQLMQALHRRWLEERNISIPSTVQELEISPLLAVEAADLPADLSVPSQSQVYLE